MIEAQLLPERTASLDRLLAQHRQIASALPAPAPVAAPQAAAASGWAEDLRFFALCYLAGFVFFLIMLT